MSLTEEEVNKIIAEECIKSAKDSLRGRDEHRAKMKLEAFEKHQRDLEIIQSYAFKKDFAQRVTAIILSILKKHKEKEDLAWYPGVVALKGYKVPGLPRETILARYKYSHGVPGKESYHEIVGRKRYDSDYRDVDVDIQRQMECQFDKILRILVVNNIIKYICCSTKCYYMYCDKK